MKLLAVLMLCAAVAAAPSTQVKEKIKLDIDVVPPADNSPEARNLVVNMLIRQVIAIIRGVINNGSSILGVPPLDPIEIEDLHLYLPAGLVNLDLKLKEIFGTGFGDFVVHRSSANLRDISLDLELSVPIINASAGKYDLIGDLIGAIPLYGKGTAKFVVENFRLRAMVYLKQSDDGASIIIDRIEDVTFVIPKFKSRLTGVIGGGDIDAIVNAIIEEVVIGYVNRFQGAIAKVVAHGVVLGLNPVLEQFETWRFIAPFV